MDVSRRPRKKSFLLGAGLYVSVVILAKLALAANLDLLGEEAFYWQASQRPALAYSDEPFVTALLVGLGTSVAGKSVLGVRLFFLLLGCALPVAIYVLAKPMVGHEDGILAAMLSLTMPLGAVLGVFAVPDVALALLTVLGAAAFERATRTGRTACWVALGVVTAFGLSTHYRFVLFISAVVSYLMFSPKGRALWKMPGLWLAASVALPGLLPGALFNWRHDFVGLQFHFVSRHPWRFDPAGLLHPMEQAGVVTPLVYVLLLLTLFHTIRESRDDDRKTIIALFSGIPIFAFWLVAPWAVQDGFTAHWPFPGYLPLLVYVPSTVRRLCDRARTSLGSRLPFVSVASGACGVALLFVYLAAGLTPDIRRAPAVWSELGARTRALVAERGSDRVLVASDYVVAAELDFQVDSVDGVFVLDASRGTRHGRSHQMRLWGLDESSLRSHVGTDALVVIEETHHDVQGREAMVAHLCATFDRLEWVSRLDLYGGARRFLFYTAEGQRPGEHRSMPARRLQSKTPCAASVANLERPETELEVNGSLTVSGWAYADGVGIESVEILIDGRPAAGGSYGVPRPDVLDRFPDSTDPNHPNVGFENRVDTSGLAPGWHALAIQVTSGGGVREVVRTRRFRVSRASD